MKKISGWIILKKLNEFYNKWINSYKEGPLLIIDADTNKFSENEEDLGNNYSPD